MKTIEQLQEENAALAAQVAGLMKIVEGKALAHISANTAEISAQAVADQSKILRAESQPPMFRQCIDNVCDWLDSRANQIRQGGE